MILSYVIQYMLQKRFDKYSRIATANGMTGADVARKMLSDNGITDVQVTCIPGKLTDHYNPATKTVNLSEAVYRTNSIAAAAVAAHECGHVIQHATGYLPLKMRTALVPAVSFSSNIVSWVLLAGVIFINIFPALLWIGIALFALQRYGRLGIRHGIGIVLVLDILVGHIAFRMDGRPGRKQAQNKHHRQKKGYQSFPFLIHLRTSPVSFLQPGTFHCTQAYISFIL